MFKANRIEVVTYNKSNEKFNNELMIKDLIEIIDVTAQKNGISLSDLSNKTGISYLQDIKDIDYAFIQSHISDLWKVVDYLGIKFTSTKLPAYK